MRTEKLWFNFTPDRVRWASYTGRNFTGHQGIRRKAANRGRRYQEMVFLQHLPFKMKRQYVLLDHGSAPRFGAVGQKKQKTCGMAVATAVASYNR
ncbi:MAG: hypothetical protein ACK5HY_06055 [Parahaliea sp.]